MSLYKIICKNNYSSMGTDVHYSSLLNQKIPYLTYYIYIIKNIKNYLCLFTNGEIFIFIL